MGLIGKKHNIEHIDTNIMVRLITRDDEKLLKKARKLFSNQEKLFVFEDAAMMELVYVLSTSVYHYSREVIAEKIKAVMEISNLVCNKGLVTDALYLYTKHPKLSFVDCYLAAATNISGEAPLWTLDHKLAAQCKVAKEL